MAKRKYSYPWPRPAVTVDIALFTVAGALQNLRLRVLLIERGEQPFRGAWALPGGFVRQDEDLQAAALRELQEETGIAQVFLEQVGAVGTPGRDPRGHVVTVLYVGLVAGDRHQLASQGDAAAVRWFDLAAGVSLPPLAFDHALLLRQALAHLRRRLDEAPALCAELLPERFTLSELQALAEAIAGQRLDRRNFRRKVKETPDLLRRAEGSRREGRHRPAQLYRFVSPPDQAPAP
ncbi:MAG: NUDIX hydrolase [Planctomycetes bacterium]|nr:NUDIX hydrolase [Planctomycetota bacterium]